MKLANVSTLILLLCLPVASFSQEGAPQMSEETKKMMEVWMQYAAPGEAHKNLMALAGSYNIATKSRFEPNGPFVESKGTCEKKAVLGDRYLSEHCNGEAHLGFPAFEGLGMMGYNNYKKQYEMFWFDNMSTMAFVLEGTADASGKVISAKGSYEDPMTKKNKKARWVWTIQDSNNHKLELYDIDNTGKEFLSAEINYIRK
jgi:hypothetical protein